MSRAIVGAGEQVIVPITHQGLSAAKDTDQRFTIVALTLPPHHPGTPLHAHATNAEGCYVLEGTLAVTQGDRTLMLTPGTATSIPVGVSHSIWNPTAGPTTVLLIYTPGVVEVPVDLLAEGMPEGAPPFPDTS